MRHVLRTSSVAVLGWALLGACGNSSDSDGDGTVAGDGDGDRDGSDIDLTGDGDGDGDVGSDFQLEPGPLSQEELEELRESACTGWSFEPELQPSVLELIIDVSGSMSQDAPGSNDSKWQITREALRDTVEALPGTISVGAVYYPNQNTQANCENGQNSCGNGGPGPVTDPTECVNFDTTLEVAALGDATSPHRDAFYDSLDAANPQGGTPTHDAYELAKQELDASDAIGQRFLLLITDGQPTFLKGCAGSGLVSEPVNEQPIIDAIAAAADEGVRTFVIGSPGSEDNQSTGDDARPWLSRAAIEGGTALAGCDESGPNYCHFDMSQQTDFSTALREALAAILGQITSCTLTVPQPPDGQVLDPNEVNVILTPFDAPAEVLGRTSEDDCSEGWDYSDGTQSISLCEETCLSLRENSSSGIELLFGCQTAEGGVR